MSGAPPAPAAPPGRSERPPNRLTHATSPYLLQHAHNPVDWYEWGPEALERAKREDRPVLLSVGYAACHWCHVMAHESFEDEAVARVMNEHFVCVKVDREERPDVDAIYMDAVQAMTGQGGWPMTVFLTPAGEPFYAGTYFPPEDRHGLPGFPRLLFAIAETWRERRDDVLTQGRRVADALGRSSTSSSPGAGGPLTEDLLREAHASLARSFDATWGGFGGAPKFPQPATLEFLLRCHLRGYPGSLEMVRTTLDRMAAGGIHDQVGGGFHRYSVDERWHVPHFEKMLYDNAQLALVYLHAWQVSHEERYREAVVKLLDYLLREMRHPEGGFYSSQDADSEGVEGKFFVWSWDELIRVVDRTIGGEHPSRSADAVAGRLGALPEGNWEGTNVLWLPEALPDGSTLEPLVDRSLGRLFEVREERVHPAVDDKVLAAWNGLAIRAFAEAGRVLREPRYVDAAVEAASFVLANLRGEDGRLLRSWREGRTSGPGYVDDHAMMAAACLSLYESTFETRWAAEARRLAGEMVDLFHDPDGGGFFQTGSDAEVLLVRPKDLLDNPVPSGNSVAADVLQRLALLTRDAGYERVAVSALQATRDLMARAPTALGHGLCALDGFLSRAKEVAIVGDRAGDAEALVSVVWQRFLPSAVLAVGRPDDEEAARVVPLLAGRPTLEGRATAYVCEGFACRRPVTDPVALAAQLDE